MKDIVQKVQNIINEVKANGDTAVVKYTRLFDGLPDYSEKDIRQKVSSLPKIKDKSFIKAINIAIKNVKKFHLEEYKNFKKFWLTKYENLVAGQKYVCVDSVGIYIPGGKYGYNYISTLLMTVIPAKIAGVKKIVVCTPPKNVTNYFLYTLYKLGIKQIFKIGGVQAIAAMAYGTKTVPKVDMIVGPGNIWVTEAKRQLVGVVGIDLLAGPSEVVVVADKDCDIEKVVFELLAQAEHDKNAKGYLISLDESFARKVREYINTQSKELAKQIDIVFETNVKKVTELINKIAPEHLTLFTKKQNEIIKNIRNVGAIFYGYNPSAVYGDYIAGPSHVLPTNTSAKFSSGLSVISFFKKISMVKFSWKSVNSLSQHTAKLAEIEGMFWHKKRVELSS